jgi:oligoribonuclease
MDKKLVNAKIDRILWMDLEMTGLQPNDDLILEVAAIVTDWDFNEIATYEGIVMNEDLTMRERLTLNEFWAQNVVSRDNLITQNADGKPIDKIEDELIAFIDEHFEKGKPVLLAGNSIHMDRRFITAQWQRFDARLHYRMLDVSAWKVVFESKFKKRFAKSGDHRALGDIRGSIEELKYYLKRVKP